MRTAAAPASTLEQTGHSRVDQGNRRQGGCHQARLARQPARSTRIYCRRDTVDQPRRGARCRESPQCRGRARERRIRWNKEDVPLRVTFGRDRRIWFCLSASAESGAAEGSRDLCQAISDALAQSGKRLVNPTRPADQDSPSDLLLGWPLSREWAG
jgi:hypothetical protein